ncbi:MAG TPA: Gmad2 immunoglobulin-like domain-containing protein [Rubrobacter sp.]|nr:Gmad2 immunoglobulin-like domain-containing protein [Rubrobacter sp.]
MSITGRVLGRVLALQLLSLLVVTLISGCSGSDLTSRSEKVSGDAARGDVPESTVGASLIDGDLTRASDVSPQVVFVGRPEDGGGSGYDADTVLGVRYGLHHHYERAVIDLGTGKRPAGTVPEWTLTSPEGEGLLRVNLPSAVATCVSGGEFDKGLLESFHVVRAPDGGMFVDFLTRQPFRYRVLQLQDPARLVLDFEPSEESLKAPPPAQGGDTVLVEPRPNVEVSDPLTVSGYSRNPEAANTITLTGPDGEILARRNVRSNDWSHTWGYFDATIDLPPFSGKGTLKVGTGNARDGTFEGVEVPVRAGHRPAARSG